MQNPVREAHRYSTHHRSELEKDTICGCFYCLAIFPPSEITDWIDDDDTALCPKCSIDSIIGESSGFPITKEFLKKMNEVWF